MNKQITRHAYGTPKEDLKQIMNKVPISYCSLLEGVSAYAEHFTNYFAVLLNFPQTESQPLSHSARIYEQTNYQTCLWNS